jgi:hypothetical protein
MQAPPLADGSEPSVNTFPRNRTFWLASLGLACGTLVLPIPSASAAGAATRFVVVHEPETFTATAFCLPEDMVGTAVTQETITGTSVETTSGVSVVTGVDEFTFRIDFPDGSYVEAGDVDRDHFHFVGNRSAEIFTRVTQDFETIYDADGTAVGKIMVNATLHTSWHDADRDGIPDDGEFTTQVDSFRLRCM